jgi:hypothetical protein
MSKKQYRRPITITEDCEIPLYLMEQIGMIIRNSIHILSIHPAAYRIDIGQK